MAQPAKACHQAWNVSLIPRTQRVESENHVYMHTWDPCTVPIIHTQNKSMQLNSLKVH